MSKEAEKYAKSKGYLKTPFFPMDHIARLMQSYANEQNKELLKRLDDKYTAYPNGWGNPLNPQDNE